MTTFISPFTDFGFKRIFGQEDSKIVLIGFLNALFEGEFVVSDLEYRDKEQLPEHPDMRNAIFDIYCTLETGEHFILEMQNNYQKHFEDRALYYAARRIARQGKKGPWDYAFNAVYGIYFMNFVDSVLLKDFRNDYGICKLANNENTAIQQVLTRKLRMVFLQLPLFTKTENDCKTDLDKWTYILVNMDTLNEIPWRKEKEAFDAIAEIGSYEALSEEDRNRYDEALRNYQDSIAVYEGAIEKGIDIGIEKGIEKGIKQGEHNKSIKIAKMMKADGVSEKQIAQYTGLTQEEIDKL